MDRSWHHAAAHRGQLRITGSAPKLQFSWTHAVDPHVGVQATGAHAAVAADANLALETLGFSNAEAKRAVDRALHDAPPTIELTELIRRALAFCPKPHC